jgi:hypothetical protein
MPTGKQIPEFLNLTLGFDQSISESKDHTDMPQHWAPLLSHALDLTQPFNSIRPDVTDAITIGFRSYDPRTQKNFDHFRVHAAEPGRLFKLCPTRIPSGANQWITCFHRLECFA